MMACHNRQTFFTVPAIMKICSLYWVVSYKGRQSLICALLNMFLYFCMCLQDASPQSGLLQSSIITMYTMYITWSAMTNNPSKLHIKKSQKIFTICLWSLFSFYELSFCSYSGWCNIWWVLWCHTNQMLNFYSLLMLVTE